MGFSNDTAIVTGTTDSTASTLATGVSKPGEAVTTLGTTLVMKIIAQHQITSVADGVYSHRLPNGLWLAGGASNSGGNVLLKYFDADEIAVLSTQMQTTSLTGLDYYPLSIKGERFPVNDPEMLPCMNPRPASDSLFLQAIFEGFAKIEKRAYQKLAELGAPEPSAIVSAGGQAAKNTALTAIRSQILGIPVTTASHTEASYGVALVAKQAWNKRLH
jgi:sugar (pentulose or hexulose) kinase